MSAIIGIISTMIMDFSQNFKLGITEVQEDDHTLILGWNGSTIPLIEELCLAADSRRWWQNCYFVGKTQA